MTTLIENIGKEVFIVGGDIDSFHPGPLFIEKTLKAFEKKINLIPVNVSEELRIVHGYLTSAMSIPKNIPDKTEIFLILSNANKEQDSFVIDIASLYLLKKVIEAMVNLDKITEDDTEEIIDYITNVDKQKIDNIFILYGYSIETTHHIPKTSLKILDLKNKNNNLKQVVEN